MSILVFKANSAMEYAASGLSAQEFEVTDSPGADVTHLLLPVPVQGDYAPILRQLPNDTVVFGGNLDGPEFGSYSKVDLLKDEAYLTANAAITATCAADLPGIDYAGTQVLILGWGRIGKRLARILAERGACVTVSARNPADLARVKASGMNAVPIHSISGNLSSYHVIFNTVPAMILPDLHCRPECLIYELASRPGMSGPNITSARGLPGKYAPERSGALIAETVMRYLCRED